MYKGNAGRDENWKLHICSREDNFIGILNNFMLRLLLFDHTLRFKNDLVFRVNLPDIFGPSTRFIVISVVFIYLLYVVQRFILPNICSYLYWDKKLRKYYARSCPILFCFRYLTYYVPVPLCCIINSIKECNWRTKSFKRIWNIQKR